IVFVSCICAGALCAQSVSDTLYLRNKNYAVQTALYSIYKTEKADVVMLGNSITFGVNWNELMGRTNIVNRGIGSDLTQGFLHRLEYVYNVHPKVCCIMGGINDIYENIPVEKIYEHYIAVIDSLREHNIIPVIQSTLFVSPKWKRAAEKNIEVERLNGMLIEYARKEKILFLDLNRVLSEHKILKDEFTIDGVHLNAKGYELWRKELEPVLEKYGL
ncbi:MAG: GDSL family lipase, partial [Bacteroidota bacterium]|nr:GDSL family lipase [Bacteroidota bacterium]